MTVVIDASATAEILLGSDLGARVVAATVGEDVHAPHLVVSECAFVLRRLNLTGLLSGSRGATALQDLAAMPWTLWDATPLLPQVWVHRHNLTAYDATYVALAEGLGAPLVTTDQRLVAAAPEVCRLISG